MEIFDISMFVFDSRTYETATKNSILFFKLQIEKYSDAWRMQV